MTAKPHKSCVGTMLPSMLSLRTGKPVAGKAFSVFLGMPHGTVVTERRVEVDMEQWDDHGMDFHPGRRVLCAYLCV